MLPQISQLHSLLRDFSCGVFRGERATYKAMELYFSNTLAFPWRSPNQELIQPNLVANLMKAQAVAVWLVYRKVINNITFLIHCYGFFWRLSLHISFFAYLVLPSGCLLFSWSALFLQIFFECKSPFWSNTCVSYTCWIPHHSLLPLLSYADKEKNKAHHVHKQE